MAWKDEQIFEKNWWGNCLNTFGEETKQLTYAKKMGFQSFSWEGKWPVYNMQNQSVLDIGGGPVSLLLKCVNLKESFVVDPCDYPDWIIYRYREAGITFLPIKGEDLLAKNVDEVWIYNVLQHVDDPEKVIKNAQASGKLIRVFEWIDMPPVAGHPHELKEETLNKWLHGKGKVEQLNENGCVGRAYYGVFLGDRYNK